MGNDLVDLKLAAVESNWRRRGYLTKLFTAAEQYLIGRSERPDEVLWMLWSMKEAAYKIHSRKTGIRSFAPTTLACSSLRFQDGTACGSVYVDQDVYHTRTEVTTDYIHSIAAGSPEVLPLIKAEIYKWPATKFDYKARNPGCVSHHGRYLALVF
jgi:phosphopantetheinyl transferase (holo-ACP synthase)